MSLNERGHSVGWKTTKGGPYPDLAPHLNPAALPGRRPAFIRPSINTGVQISDSPELNTMGSYKDTLWG